MSFSASNGLWMEFPATTAATLLLFQRSATFPGFREHGLDGRNFGMM
jgi:hypothetical protein